MSKPEEKGIGNLISHLRGHRTGTVFWVAHVVSWPSWRSPIHGCLYEWPDGHISDCMYRTCTFTTPGIFVYGCTSRLAVLTLDDTMRAETSLFSTTPLVLQQVEDNAPPVRLRFVCISPERPVFHCSLF